MKISINSIRRKNFIKFYLLSIFLSTMAFVSFNPQTREFKDYGYLYKQNWFQYPKFLATDDKGFVYFGLGNTFTQIIAFNPVAGKATPMLEEPDFGRTAGSQSPRIFVSGPGKDVYILYNKGIVKIEPGPFKLTMIAESPVPIDVGGDYLDGRFYFISGSHLCSYKL